MRIDEFEGNPAPSRLLFGAVLAALALLLRPNAATAATITVTSNADNTTVDGAVTLREAIISINNGANLNADVVAVGTYGTGDTINFSIGTGLQTITLFQLPAITKPVVINGTTQPGFAGTPLIVLDGGNLNSATRGLTISGGSSTVRGLDIIQFGIGIELNTAGGNTIVGNFIGINAAGTTAAGNATDGIFVNSSSSNNVIGGTTAADRNVISGGFNNDLVRVDGGGSVIQGNYIGTNAAGTAALAAGGINIDVNGTNTTIGGTVGTTPGGPCTGACNLIAGKGGLFFESGAAGGQVQGNLIGTNAAGTSAIPTAFGIVLNSSNHVVGGLTPSAMNVIAFNNSSGVTVTDNGAGNAILGNSIFSNLLLGIDLGPTGVTPNDVGDADIGANNLQNFPVITSVSIVAGNATIGGTLNSLASRQFRIEFFSNVSCNAAPPNNFGEGQSFLGGVNVLTDGSGNATFNTTLPVPAGQSVITSTATLLAAGSLAPVETSEFSACFTQGAVTNTPTSTPTSTPTNTFTSTPTSTPTGAATNTPTNTPTFTPSNTPTRTPTLNPSAAVVPTLSPSMLGLLALALAGAAIFLFRRS